MSFSSSNQQPPPDPGGAGYDGRFEMSSADFDLIVGSRIGVAKGDWTRDGVSLVVGPKGVQMTIFMSTARHGTVAWDDSGDRPFPVVQNLRLYRDCDPPRERMPEGLQPYTIWQCLLDGKLATCASSSWGMRNSFRKDILGDWRYLHPRECPVVTLGVRPSGDANNNVAPEFTIVRWVPVDSLGMLVGADKLPVLTDGGSVKIENTNQALSSFAKAKQEVTTGRQEANFDNSEIPF